MSVLATTHPFRAFGHGFDVETVPALAAHLDHVFGALASDAVPDHHYALLPVEEGGREWRLRVDDDVLASSTNRGYLYSQLCWHINRQAIRSCEGLVLLHASCATDANGRAVILPAAMESGKTTTVAGLVRSGLQYVTDEATAVEPATGRIVPYPKPLSIDPGSWQVLTDLRPAVDRPLRAFLRSQWHVPGQAIGTVAQHAVPALIVTPQYDASVDGAELAPMTGPETLMTLASNAFNMHAHGSAGFHALAEVARRCPGYRIRIGDLGAAVSTIRRLLEEPPR